MNDFIYPPMSKETSKIGGLYSTDTPSCNKQLPNRSSSYSQQAQDYDQWRSNSLPMSMSTPPLTNSNSNSPAINPVTCDLQEVIIYYQSQPELLRLILLSKVEEDKRRAEEAKLRAKELDMVLAQQQQQLSCSSPQTPDNNTIPLTQQNNNLMSSTMNNNNFLNTTQYGQAAARRPSVLELLMDDNDCDRRDSALGSSFDGSAKSDELDDCSFSPNTSTAAVSMLSMSFPAPQPLMPRSSLHPLSPPYNMSQALDDNSFNSQIALDSSESTPDQQQQQQFPRCDSYFPQRPRRRREMQAISKIVETRDYPYVDGFFWKNNGNTIQKKTGNKSVYYKCSNSSKGCPVNKTVTWKDNGEYLIKYRGEHLGECGKVQRIVDM